MDVISILYSMRTSTLPVPSSGVTIHYLVPVLSEKSVSFGIDPRSEPLDTRYYWYPGAQYHNHSECSRSKTRNIEQPRFERYTQPWLYSASHWPTESALTITGWPPQCFGRCSKKANISLSSDPARFRHSPSVHVSLHPPQLALKNHRQQKIMETPSSAGMQL